MKKSRCFQLLSAACLGLTLGFAGVVAADVPAKTIAILHKSPDARELPFPGDVIDLTVNLINTTDFETPLRTVVVRDGKMLELPAVSGSLDLSDKPIYHVLINAPVESLSYQFFLEGTGRILATSPRFYVRRVCAPNIELTDTTGNNLTEIKDPQERVALVSQGLERDIRLYQTLFGVLTDVSKLTGAGAEK